jgi:hypothetical protein
MKWETGIEVKRTVSLLSSLALVFALPLPSLAQDPNPVPPELRERVVDASWESPDHSKHLLTFAALGGVPFSPPPVILQNLTKKKFCENALRSCISNGDTIAATGYATYCAEKEQIPCVSKVEFRKTGSTDWVEAKFVNYWDTTPSEAGIAKFFEDQKPNPHHGGATSASKNKTWKDDPTIGLMGSAPGPMMFSIDEFPNQAGTTNYLISANYSQFMHNFRSGKPSSQDISQFMVFAQPIVEVSRPGVFASMEGVFKQRSGGLNFGGTSVGGTEGFFQVNDRVAYAVRFDPELEMQISLKIPSSVGGWFHSRLTNPSLNMKRISANVNELVLAGAAAEVPITNHFVDPFLPENRKLYESIFGPWDEDRGNFQSIRRSGGGGGASGTLWDPNNGLDLFDVWFPTFEKKAKGSLSAWSVARMPTQRLGNNRCMNRTDRIQGLINTNAMVYQSLVPEYRRGFLNYQVAGVHMNMDGEVFKGQYDLIMRSDAARCLYGFSKAPVSGTVTVLDAKGQTEVSTTTLGEKNGWLRLSAKNFTFSKKTIRLKLTQRR